MPTYNRPYIILVADRAYVNLYLWQWVTERVSIAPLRHLVITFYHPY